MQILLLLSGYTHVAELGCLYMCSNHGALYRPGTDRRTSYSTFSQQVVRAPPGPYALLVKREGVVISTPAYAMEVPIQSWGSWWGWWEAELKQRRKQTCQWCA